MVASIFGIFFAIAVGLASAQEQCTAPQVIWSDDGIANYSISGLQMSQTFYYNYNSNGIPTTLALSICSQDNCNSQCAVKTTATNNGASTCYGKCTDTAYIFAQDNYLGLILTYTADSNSSKVTLHCNPYLSPSKVVIKQVTQNGSILTVTGETYCNSTPKKYTMKKTYYGKGWPCANQNYLGGNTDYSSTCTTGCSGNYDGSVSTDCVAHF